MRLTRLAAQLATSALIAGVLLLATSTPAHAVAHIDWPMADIHPITFPVQGATSYSDVFGDPRSVGTEQGTDIFGTVLQHEVAAVDGTITYVNVGGPYGNFLILTGDDGWSYDYLHINDDTPGADDEANPAQWRFAPGIAPGVRVHAGDFLAFMGNSGNAEQTSVHLCFEMHRPDHSAVDSYPSLRLAQGLPAGNHCAYASGAPQSPNPASVPGYWVLASDGGVFTFGAAGFYGSTGAMQLNKPVVGMTATPTGKGYWLVASDGGIFTFGDARFFGSTGAMRLNKPVVGMAATPTGKGYWLVASDGGIFTFGDARFFGSTGAVVLNKPIMAMTPTHSGAGYWLVASDGGIFTFGDATFAGALPGTNPAVGAVSMATAPSGTGYWILGTDGAVYPYGSAPAFGSLISLGLCHPDPVNIAPDSTGNGYWIQEINGSVQPFGDAAGYGGLSDLGITPKAPLIGFTVMAPPSPPAD